MIRSALRPLKTVFIASPSVPISRSAGMSTSSKDTAKVCSGARIATGIRSRWRFGWSTSTMKRESCERPSSPVPVLARTRTQLESSSPEQ